MARTHMAFVTHPPPRPGRMNERFHEPITTFLSPLQAFTIVCIILLTPLLLLNPYFDFTSMALDTLGLSFLWKRLVDGGDPDGKRNKRRKLARTRAEQLAADPSSNGQRQMGAHYLCLSLHVF